MEEEEEEEEGEEKETENDEGIENDEEEDSDESDDDDDDETDDEIDEEFKQNVKEALGDAAVLSEEESEDDEDFDDEAMMRIDSALATVFKEKKNNKKAEKRMAREQLTHFQLRCLDLLDSFVLRNKDSDIVFDLILPLKDVIMSIVDDGEKENLLERTSVLLRLKLLKMKFSQKTLSAETVEKLHGNAALAMEFVTSRRGKKTSNKFTGELLSQCILFFIRVLKHAKPSNQGDDILCALDEKRVTSLYCECLNKLFTERKANNSAAMREVLGHFFERFPVMSETLIKELLQHYKNATHQVTFNHLLHSWLRSVKSLDVIPVSCYHDILACLVEMLSSVTSIPDSELGMCTLNQAKTSSSHVFIETRLCCEQIMKRDGCIPDDTKTKLTQVLKAILKVTEIKRSSKLTNLANSIFKTIKAEWTEEELLEIKKEKEAAKLMLLENQKKKKEKKALGKKRKVETTVIDKEAPAVANKLAKTKNYGKKTKKFDMKKSGKFSKKKTAI